MKTKQRPPLTVPKQKAIPEHVQQLADKLGQQYTTARETEQTAAQAKQEVAEHIKRLGAAHGVCKGATQLVAGEEWEVGVQTAAGAATIDWVRFGQVYPKLAARLSSVQIDETKVARALSNGTLSAELLNKFTTRGSPTQRVVVRRRNHVKDE